MAALKSEMSKWSRILQSFFLVICLHLCSMTADAQLRPNHDGAHSYFTGNEVHDDRTAATGRNFFFDFGGNDGSSTTFFLGCKVFGCDGGIGSMGGSKSKLEGLGSANPNEVWNIVVFEANPRFSSKLNTMAGVIMNKTNHVVTIHGGTAISTHNGEVDFWFDTTKDKPVQGKNGASIMKNSHSVSGKANGIKVKEISIVSLFRDLRISKHDHVIVKMDIEGAEYDVLRHFVRHGMLYLVDTLAIEWHHENRYVYGRDPVLHDQYLGYYNALAWMIEGSGVSLDGWGR